MTNSLTIGIDTGGTFTDAFVANDKGGHWVVKVPTTPHDLTVCFADVIDQSAAALQLGREELLRRTNVIRFSSTIATNTVLTRSGPKLGLVVTAGEEGSLYGAAEGGHVYGFVGQDMVAGIEEIVTPEGRVERPPDRDEVDRVVKDLLERGARIIVVGLRNAGLNAENELEVMRIVDQSYPRHYLGAVPILLSTHVSGVARDADRTAAAVVNAYMHRKLATSLYKAEDDLRSSGLRHPLLIVTTDGSVTRVAKTRAISTYQSGPTAGVYGSATLCRSYGIDAAVTADVGGTSTDFGVIAGGRPAIRGSVDVGGLEVVQPSAELFSIGLGGGSICTVAGDNIEVGPRSAGAAPGPACFGMGGRDVTPTDAWLALGYLDAEYYLGGRRRLIPELAKSALDGSIGVPLGLTTEETALRVKEAVEQVAARGIEQMLARPSVRAALGDRSRAQVALVAYGGAGGILLPTVARTVGFTRTFLPALSPAFSAFGVSTFDVEHRYEARTTVDARGGIAGALDPLVESARRDVRGEGFDPESARFSVNVFDEEGSPLLEGMPLPNEADAPVVSELPPGISVIVSLSASIEVAKPGLPGLPDAGDPDPSDALSGKREVILEGGSRTVFVYARDKLRAGHATDGPCLVESSGSTYLIPDGAVCRIDRFATAIVE